MMNIQQGEDMLLPIGKEGGYNWMLELAGRSLKSGLWWLIAFVVNYIQSITTPQINIQKAFEYQIKG